MTQAETPSTPAGIVVLSGPSGSGKTTVVERLLGEAPVKLMKAVSATTRPARPGETDGDAYYFLTEEEFERRREGDEFIECAEVFKSGYWYGTLRSELQRAAESGAWAFLEIDVQGALNVIGQYPDATTIFLKTPSAEEYERRLRNRGTEHDEEVIQRRLRTALQELQHVDRYRYVVVNDNLEQTVSEISEILRDEESSTNA